MKKLIIALFGALLLLSTTSIAAFTEPPTLKGQKPEPFDGSFEGTLYGSKGSSAPLTLNLSQTGATVKGNVWLGSGLYVDGGFCGGAYVPSATQSATGRIVANNANRLTADSSFKVSGMTIKVKLIGDAPASGDAIKTKITVDLPWLCGQDPELGGTLYRTK